jgi:hypothetical protein
MSFEAVVGAGHPTVQEGCLPFFHDFSGMSEPGFHYVTCVIALCFRQSISLKRSRNKIVVKPCNRRADVYVNT